MTPRVDYIHPHLAEKIPTIRRVSTAVAGTRAVKAEKETYLPKPNASDTSTANKARYDSYLERALFLGATAQTLEGFVGQVFAKDPVMELPAEMSFVGEDVDCSGNSISNQAKDGLRLQFKKGGGGLLVDYPTVNQESAGHELSKAEVEQLGLRPRILQYDRDCVINWRKATIGGKVKLTLVVLKEEETVADDGFEAKTEPVYRVLRLDKDAGFYYVEIWKKGTVGFELKSMNIPTDGWGKRFMEIQFFPFSWDNNDIEPSSIPLEQLAELDFGWYRNSADYEESCFISGQPTLVLSGLDQSWVDDVLKGKVELGSRAAVPLPTGGQAMLIQATANSMPKEAMADKQQQMAAIGAELMEQNMVQRSATEASLEASARTSVLGSAAMNYSDAMTNALKSVAAFLRIELPDEEQAREEVLSFELSTDFDMARMTAQERAQLLAEWQGRGITFEEYRWNLKKAGVAYMADEDAKDAFEAEVTPVQPAPAKVDPNKTPKSGPDDAPTA